jgi:2-polyprenyl-3-methyl-5-hydroxy-6-metoxy-1,4-benzoquinol methylase
MPNVFEELGLKPIVDLCPDNAAQNLFNRVERILRNHYGMQVDRDSIDRSVDRDTVAVLNTTTGSYLIKVLRTYYSMLYMNLAGALSKRLSDPIVQILRPWYQRFENAKLRLVMDVAAFADSYELINPEDIYSEYYYKKRQSDPWRSEAHHISNVLYQEFQPDSVIDFGCAIGHYLEGFQRRGAKITGIEANSKAINYAVIDSVFIHQHDLRDSYESSRTYDIALCFEVAEHLSDAHSDTLVKTITQSANIVVFTAAKPGQRGTFHVNLQPREYWINKFNDAGFEYQEETTRRLNEQFNVDHLDHMEDNLFVFELEET